MKQQNIIILGIVSWIFIVFALFGLFITYESGKEQLVTSEVKIETDLPCSNLDLIETAECLREEQGKWWEYNISNLGLYWDRSTGNLEDVNWSVIKESGGVCSHASLWYIQEAEKLGFMGKEIKFWGNDPIGHEVALIYSTNLSFYCILDQQAIPKCTKLNPRQEVKNEI